MSPYFASQATRVANCSSRTSVGSLIRSGNTVQNGSFHSEMRAEALYWCLIKGSVTSGEVFFFGQTSKWHLASMMKEK